MSLDIKRGDTWPPMVLYVTDNGLPVDLTAAVEVRVVIRVDGGAGIALGPATISDAPGGAITYTWQVSDTAVSGDYLAEAEILWANGSVQTIPAAGYEELRINEDLGGIAGGP